MQIRKKKKIILHKKDKILEILCIIFISFLQQIDGHSKGNRLSIEDHHNAFDFLIKPLKEGQIC